MTLFVPTSTTHDTAIAAEHGDSSIIARRRHRWTLADYDRALDANLVEGRTELIDGEILDMMADGDLHRIAVSRLLRQLMRHFDEPDFLVTGQSTARLDTGNAPAPDGMVELPQSVTRGANVLVKPILVIEVSESTLLFDQVVKSSLYASKGIADYWIVNLRDGHLEVYRKPVKDDERKFGFRYSEPMIIRPPESVSPLAKPDVAIPVTTILPG